MGTNHGIFRYVQILSNSILLKLCSIFMKILGQVKNREFYSRVVNHGSLGIGESYMGKFLQTEIRLVKVLFLIMHICRWLLGCRGHC